MKQIKALNIITILSMGMIGSYWSSTLFSSSDLGENDKDIISIYIAIVIALTTATILILLIYSTISLNKGIYKKHIQKVATILVVAFVVVSDLFVFRFFVEFSIMSKIIFICMNLLTILLASSYLKAKNLNSEY